MKDLPRPTTPSPATMTASLPVRSWRPTSPGNVVRRCCTQERSGDRGRRHGEDHSSGRGRRRVARRLSMAIALAHRGASVTVLERTPHAGYEGGGGLGVDVDLLTSVTGLVGGPQVCQGSIERPTAWPLLAAWLETQAYATPASSSAVTPSGGGRRLLGPHDRWTALDADLVVGADGARSTVRRWGLARPTRRRLRRLLALAGHGPEAELPASIPWLPPGRALARVLLGSVPAGDLPVPGADGSCKRGIDG